MSQLNIAQLFQPAPSGVGTNPSATPPAGSWLSQLLAFATSLGLNTTSWQSGGVARTILAIAASAMSQEDIAVSIMAQGGFLDFAASGSVSYVAANGQTVTVPVTPDPSILSQNSTGALGWLDALSDSVYNVQRISSTFASGTLAIANISAASYGPFLAGTYHVANPATKATYSNTQSLTIPTSALTPASAGTIVGGAAGTPASLTTSTNHGLASGQTVYVAGVNGFAGTTGVNGFFTILVTGGTTFQLVGSSATGAWTSGGNVYLCTLAPFQADVAGAAGTSAGGVGLGGAANGGQISQLVTTNVGVNVSNLGAFVGSNFESNTALAARCRLKLQSLSPNGPAGAYQYFALTSSQLLLAQTPSVTLSGGAITRATVSASPSTGIVTTTIANAPSSAASLGTAVVAGATAVAVTAATNASPIVITTGSGHGLVTGNFATVAGVKGNTAANGTWIVTVVDGTHFSLNGSTGNGVYTAATGQVESGDLGEVDTIIQANVVPDAVTAVTASALAFPVAIIATVVVPAAQVTTYQAAVLVALTTYFNGLPIGGIVPPGGSVGTIAYNELVGVLYQAGSINGATSYVQQIQSFTINGNGSGPVATDLNYPSASHVATLPTPTITVQGV